MFSYISSNKFKFDLTLTRLSEEKNMESLEQVAEWTENKWGYLRGNPGIEKRKELMEKIKENLYVVKYANQPVGMFALHEHRPLDEETQVKELSHVYVDDRFRGTGIGSRLVEAAKKIAKEQSAALIVFDTLNPELNRFYERHGAKVVCESQFMGQPSTLLRMDTK